MERDIRRIGEALWEIPCRGKMRVPGRIYATAEMIESIFADNAPQQVANVAQLPGIVRASLAMPDIHWGYGFPIGGVAAFDVEEGIVSPGGVGYDINCGVRLMASDLCRDDVRGRMESLVDELFRRVPSGVGSTGAVHASDDELREVASQGARWAVTRGFGVAEDLASIEENGCMPGADPDAVSSRAWQRGKGQLGTLGSGNHFLEVAYVAEILDGAAAEAMGLFPEQVTVTVHCGSRGFGHQVCDDSLAAMDRAARRHKIDLPDRQLACAPVRSGEGQSYLGAMRCAVNYAFANRQIIADSVRAAFAGALGLAQPAKSLRTVYEIAHNIAKIERHEVDGRERDLCVHRKGATRAFGPGRPEIPRAYLQIGQPVLVPGDMGRCSYVLAGTEAAMRDTFGSACHGAGRAMSRTRAIERGRGRNIVRELAERGVLLRVHSRETAAEEMPEAYKDVSKVVEACVRAGIARPVARLQPLGCVKG